MKYIPKLEPNFSPLILELNEYRDKLAVITFSNGKQEIFPFGAKSEEAVERVIKFLLWQRSAVKIEILGIENNEIDKINDMYKAGQFDYDFFTDIFDKDLKIIRIEDLSFKPAAKKEPVCASFEGNRIGLDLGASSIKVWAGVNGEEVLAKSFPWRPKQAKRLDYHRKHITEAINAAKELMPGVDSVGVSTAGVVANNEILVSSLFTSIDKKEFKQNGRQLIYDIIKDMGINRISICNDGDAAAAAAYVLNGKKNVLGLSMGSSLAGGYIDKNGCFTDYISELAFVPVDLNANAPIDPWSGDKGTGVDYFSAQAVARYAKSAGITFEEELNDGLITSKVGDMLKKDDIRAMDIYDTIGICLGYTVPLYYYFYGMDSIMVMGGVTNAKAGERILENARKVLENEFTQLNCELFMPDEKIRLTGQAKIAAALP